MPLLHGSVIRHKSASIIQYTCCYKTETNPGYSFEPIAITGSDNKNTCPWSWCSWCSQDHRSRCTRTESPPVGISPACKLSIRITRKSYSQAYYIGRTTTQCFLKPALTHTVIHNPNWYDICHITYWDVTRSDYNAWPWPSVKDNATTSALPPGCHKYQIYGCVSTRNVSCLITRWLPPETEKNTDPSFLITVNVETGAVVQR